MQLNSFFYFLLLFVLPSLGFTQNNSWVCSGQVVDTLTNEPLVGANIYTSDFKYGVTTDEYGRYGLEVDSSYKLLIASYIGYESDTCFRAKSSCYFKLSPLKLKEVIVKSSKKSVQNEMGQFSPSIEQITALPTLLGDVDILKAMTLLPGVSGGVEGSSGMLVRGGNLSHNLIILDGTPVYNSSHLFGFMSAFNPDAVKYVKLYKGGFPAQYGGRLASVLNITMKDGNMRKPAANLSVGIVNSSLVVEGPIGKDKISYMIAGRLMNLSPILGLGHKASDETASYWIYDTNAKMKFNINRKQSILLSYLQSQDKFGIGNNLEKSKLKWGNKVGSIRYQNQLSSRWLLDMGIYYNRYLYSSGNETKSIETEQSTAASGIDDRTAKVKASYVASPSLLIQVGGEYGHKGFTPIDFEKIVKDSSNMILGQSHIQEQLKTTNAIAFWDNELSIKNRFILRLGARGIFHQTDSIKYQNIDLRASATLNLDERSSIKMAYDEMNQPFHLLKTVGNSAPNEIWIPTVSGISPSLSRQLSLGYLVRIPRWNTQMSVEIFAKRMKGLVRYKPGQAYLYLPPEDWRSGVIGNGEGRAEGIELFINRTAGRFTGWLGYTLSKSQRKYSQTNSGDWFAANYDRRHDLELVANYKINKKWNVSSTFIYQSGRPLTLPSAFYIWPRIPFGQNFNLVYNKINGSRTQSYHRMDLSFTRKHKTSRDRDASWTFGVYNVYARNNPFSYQASISGASDKSQTKIVLFQKSLFNVIPSINYRLKF